MPARPQIGRASSGSCLPNKASLQMAWMQLPSRMPPQPEVPPEKAYRQAHQAFHQSLNQVTRLHEDVLLATKKLEEKQATLAAQKLETKRLADVASTAASAWQRSLQLSQGAGTAADEEEARDGQPPSPIAAAEPPHKRPKAKEEGSEQEKQVLASLKSAVLGVGKAAVAGGQPADLSAHPDLAAALNQLSLLVNAEETAKREGKSSVAAAAVAEKAVDTDDGMGLDGSRKRDKEGDLVSSIQSQLAECLKQTETSGAGGGAAPAATTAASTAAAASSASAPGVGFAAPNPDTKPT